MNKIGFMQGRLVKSEKKNFIQSFPWKNWRNEFNIAKKNNIKLMEWTIDYFKFKDNPLINQKQINQIKILKKKNNLEIGSVTCDFYMQKPYIKANSKYLRKKIFQNLIDLINSCKKLNIKNIIIPLVDNSSLHNIEEENKTVEFFLKFNDLLKKNKTRILFEIDYSPKKILKFINKFDDCYGINYDTGNSASLGFKIKNEKKYFSRVHNIHIKDRLYKGNTVKLGHGNCDFKSLFSVLKKKGYKKYLILQTAKTWKNNEVGEMLDNIKFIKKFLNEK